MRTGAHVKHLAVVFKLSSCFGSLRGNFGVHLDGSRERLGRYPKIYGIELERKVFFSPNRLFRARCGCSREFKSKKLGLLAKMRKHFSLQLKFRTRRKKLGGKFSINN